LSIRRRGVERVSPDRGERERGAERLESSAVEAGELASAGDSESRGGMVAGAGAGHARSQVSPPCPHGEGAFCPETPPGPRERLCPERGPL